MPQRGISQQNCFYFQRTEVFTENIDFFFYYYYLEEMVLWEKLFSSKWYLWGLWSKESGSPLSVSMCDVSLWFQEEKIGLEHSGSVVLVVYSAHWGVWKWSGLLSVEFFWRRKASFGCLFKVLHCEGVVMVGCNVSPVCLKAACKQSTVLHRMCAGKAMQHKHYPERSWGEQAESCEPFLYVLILLFFAELLKALNH